MGQVIYFSGPDGAGKTTSLLHVLELIQKKGNNAFQLRTLQVGRLRMLERAKMKKETVAETVEITADNTEKNAGRADMLGNVGRLGYSSIPRQRGTGLRFTLRRYLGLLAAIADITTMGRTFVRAKRRDYDFVLVEECPFDVFAKRHRPYFPFTAKVLKRLIPAPDLVVFCVADPDVIVRRKPELTASEIEHYYVVMSKVYSPAGCLPMYRHDTNPSQHPFADLEKFIQDMIA